MANRVIGQGGQTDHGVIAGAVPGHDVPNVDPGARTNLLWSGTEIATLIEAEIETFHRVSGRA